jgi:hypothetical protein
VNEGKNEDRGRIFINAALIVMKNRDAFDTLTAWYDLDFFTRRTQCFLINLTGIQAGLEYVDVALNGDGSVRSLHDNVNGKTFVFEYDDNRLLKSIYDGAKKWSIRDVGERIASIIH